MRPPAAHVESRDRPTPSLPALPGIAGRGARIRAGTPIRRAGPATGAKPSPPLERGADPGRVRVAGGRRDLDHHATRRPGSLALDRGWGRPGPPLAEANGPAHVGVGARATRGDRREG